MEEPENIIEQVVEALAGKKKLLNSRFLVTAGPTYEKIDPVRFIGNFSSGKMGYAIVITSYSIHYTKLYELPIR